MRIKTLFNLIVALFCCTTLYAANFTPAFEKVILPHEGGYQAIRSDNGNWTGCRPGKGILKGTKGGISACTYPNEDIKNLTRERIAFLYKRDFWDSYRLGDIRVQTVADRILDALVNNGPIAAWWVQKAINLANGKRPDLAIDGVMGAATIAELNSINQARFMLCFMGYRFNRYDALSKQYPDFINTWLDREVDEVITAVHDRDRMLEASK